MTPHASFHFDPGFSPWLSSGFSVGGKVGVKTRQPKVALRRHEAPVVAKDEEPMDLEDQDQESEVGFI